MIYDHTKPIEELPVGCVHSHFLDSGSFTLWTKARKYAEENKCGKWDFYHTQEFWDYCDSYAAFIDKNKAAIDLYANVDVIPNPKLSYRNQRYLEDTHELSPVPVVHYTTNLKWLRYYMESGYKIVGLGGLVGSTSQDDCREWIDQAFDMVCDTPDRTPCVKLHGFGVTTYELLIRYPWYSVDSTSWTKIGAFGGILIPHKRKGKFIFDIPPYLMKVSVDSPDRRNKANGHFYNMSGLEKDIICEWLDYIGVPLGKAKLDSKRRVIWKLDGVRVEEGTPKAKAVVKEWGVITQHTYRRAANLLFFEEMRKCLPDWPWSFNSTRPKSFGLFARGKK